MSTESDSADKVADQLQALRQRVERLMREQEDFAKVTLLLNQTSLVLFRLHASQGLPIDRVSDNITLFGYLPADFTADTTTFAAITHPEDFSKILRRITMTSEGTEESFNEEFRVLTKSGEPRWVRGRFLCTLNRNHEVDYLHAVLMDLTDQKRLQAQLAEARKTEVMGRLVNAVAHEFNNVLTAIIGYSSLARDALFPRDPVRDDVEQVIEISERAASLTHRILAFARRELSPPRPVNINELLADMQDMLTQLLGEAIEFKISVDPHLGAVRVDPGQIEQVLIILTINARSVLRSGGKLSVETANVDLDEPFLADYEDRIPGDYVALRLHHAGTAGEAAARFHDAVLTLQARPERESAPGLEALHAIINQYKGLLRAETRGSDEMLLELYLPRATEETETGPERIAEAPSRLSGRETILLVEDESTVRGPAARFLRDLGYEVLQAANGVEGLALALAHEGSIDILVTDVVMPRMNGIALARRLMKERPQMAVLLISGYTDEDIEHYGKLEREVAFLQKPFSGAALANKIRELLG